MDVHLNLDLAANPEYFGLVEQQVGLMYRFNALYSDVNSFRINWLWPWGRTSQLTRLGLQLTGLLDDWLAWQSHAARFALNPKLANLQREMLELTTSHVVINLWFIIIRTKLSMESLEAHYNSLWTARGNQINFNLAMVSLLVTFLGLIATLIAFAIPR
jgi:hypothetical protein